MAEWKLFDEYSHVSTAEFHEHRQRAPHLEQEAHKARLNKAAEFVQAACLYDGEACSVSDLGCGDGGLLSVVQNYSCVSRAWGYDFQPSNEQGWRERGVTAYQKDIFNSGWYDAEFGRIAVTTEVLEHLQFPHDTVQAIANQSNFLVASSPYDEHGGPGGHDECHAWAWDYEGYAALINNNGWDVMEHVKVDGKFQVLWAVRA